MRSSSAFFGNKAAVALAGSAAARSDWRLDTTWQKVEDVRIKLPLLVLPLIFRSVALVAKAIPGGRHLAIVIARGKFGQRSGAPGLIDRPVHTVRDIFIFGISHICFSLFLCVGVYLLAGPPVSERTGRPGSHDSLSSCWPYGSSSFS